MKIRDRKQKKELSAAIGRGRELRRSGRDQEALEFLEGAIQQFPEDPELRLLHATILEQPDTAAAEAAKAAELAPDDPATLVRAGHLLLGCGDREAARDCAARANELVHPSFVLMAGLYNLNGSLAVFAGEDDLAEKNLRNAVETEPSNKTWARHLAVFLAERGRLSDAVAVLDEALKHVEDKDSLEQMRARMVSEIGG